MSVSAALTLGGAPSPQYSNFERSNVAVRAACLKNGPWPSVIKHACTPSNLPQQQHSVLPIASLSARRSSSLSICRAATIPAEASILLGPRQACEQAIMQSSVADMSCSHPTQGAPQQHSVESWQHTQHHSQLAQQLDLVAAPLQAVAHHARPPSIVNSLLRATVAAAGFLALLLMRPSHALASTDSYRQPSVTTTTSRTTAPSARAQPLGSTHSTTVASSSTSSSNHSRQAQQLYTLAADATAGSEAQHAQHGSASQQGGWAEDAAQPNTSPNLTHSHQVGMTPPQLTGDALLVAQEAAVAALFRAAQPSVVNVSGVRAAGTFSVMDVARPAPGQGTGFIWDERGHVVTAHSCVRGAAEVKVTLWDGSSYTAKVVGADAGKDVAVLRLTLPKSRLKDLVPARLGAACGPGGLAVGHTVFALGAPTGLDHTLTQGVVSGLGRELPAGGPFPLKGLIQADAACGHQAGGVLLNTQGRVVGMVVSPYAPGGRAAGYALGYALPIDAMRGLVTQVLSAGRPTRPTLGVTLAPPQVLGALGVEGVLVLEVPAGSPAAAAGLRHTHRDIFGDVILGDVIVGLEGSPVRHAGDLYAALDGRRAGERVKLDILRDGKATGLTLVLGERGAAGQLEE